MAQNPMQAIKVEKVVLNIGTGKEQVNIERGLKLLSLITGRKPIKTLTDKRIPGWGLRPGLPVGVKVTVRKDDALELLKRLLDAREYRLSKKMFDLHGNISFGLTEYIDIPGMKYDPEIGMMGLQVTVTLERPGFRVKRRKQKTHKPGKKHTITQDEAIAFMKSSFGVKIIEEEDAANDNE